MNTEIEKGIEEDILEYLEKSENFWTDLYPFIKKSQFTYSELYDVLSELKKENKIKIKGENNIAVEQLRTTRKGRLINKHGLLFRIEPEYQSRLRNDLNSLKEQSITTYKDSPTSTKSTNAILQNIFWIVLIIGGIITIHKFIEEQFELNIIKWVSNKFK
ncbi:hypothetical protein [Tenacibaculum dicentrarchi]|uniref:hypothetical protein n=1 Tax=Tenacibaculum dicentrarchi TaxID=669041 RepID=UPI000C7DB387|nr:hypothetical protein TDCHD05_270005 [Tenacibaculum dicentrarchi]